MNNTAAPASDKHDYDLKEEMRLAQTSKRKTCMRHCKRFWWIYLIAFVCIVVLVVCLVIFVAVPNIAQDKINDAELEVVSIAVSQTQSESYTLEINSIIHSDGSTSATIDPFDGVIYLEDLEPHTPFVRVHFPQTSAAERQEITLREDVHIEDMDAFTTFTTWVVNNETLRLTVEGKTRVKTSGLSRKYDVDFKKTVEVAGFNKLRGAEIVEEESRISLAAQEGEPNFRGVAVIPNPSVISLDIGNVTFSNSVGATAVGSLSIDDLQLLPGNNTVNVSAVMDQITLIGLASSPEFCEDGTLPFTLRGDTVVNHGQSLSYFADALASADITVNVDVATLAQESLNITLSCPGEGGGLDLPSLLGGLLGQG
ncbi:hypothetical protein B0I35DRAFT_24302 [Stachybotrys elegans]|uniref:Uncharacterized protein n=1 Tax=Stachybotrys elegans TaxID=80388 RepID=A0A8K0T1B4_9HYPO|nr:hypothetical protein B0I35DRAFT_24302 [Stachybotrys elegans]